MNKISLNLDSSIEWLNSGKTLIHPTESIWGIGCDAFNKDAVENIFNLKKRNKNKSFILLVDSLEAIEKYLQEINIDDKKIKDEIVNLKKLLMNLNFQKSSGQLEKTSKIKDTKKQIARLKTSLSNINGEKSA